MHIEKRVHAVSRWARGTAALVASLAAIVVLQGFAAAAPAAPATVGTLNATGTAGSCSGSAKLVPSPLSSELLSVSSSANDAWAVGYLKHTATTLHWNGSTWTSVGNPSPTPSILWGVSELSPSNVWAVGNIGSRVTLAEYWNGATWAIVRTPKESRPTFFSVSTVSPTSAWAVGYAYDSGAAGGGYIPLAEQWNGIAWKASPIGLTGYLNGVVEINPDDVWAVGEQTTGAAGGSYTSSPLILNWNGLTWQQYAGADSVALLRGVSAAGANNVWVVGDDNGGVTEHWDGVSWSVVANATPPLGSLRGVATISPTDAWAVGDYSPGPGDVLDTVVEHWNGVSWQLIPSHSAPSKTNYLFSVTGSATGSYIWSVGSVSTSKHTVAVIERTCS